MESKTEFQQSREKAKTKAKTVSGINSGQARTMSGIRKRLASRQNDSRHHFFPFPQLAQTTSESRPEFYQNRRSLKEVKILLPFLSSRSASVISKLR